MALQKQGMPQPAGNIDEVCEFAINFLLTGQGDARRLAVTLAERGPHSPPLDLTFVLSLAAASIEEVLSSPEVAITAADAWRTAALVVVDLHMMQQRGMPHHTCADLLRYWQTIDGFFLA